MPWYRWAMSEQPSEYGGRPGLLQSEEDGAVYSSQEQLMKMYRDAGPPEGSDD